MPEKASSSSETSTVDRTEIDKFAAMAADWWDPDGKFRPLHQLNPVRLGYIRNHICKHFARSPEQVRPLRGLKILDVGCGGGLLCEPLTRMGAEVTGLDATEKTIGIARNHASQMGLKIDYRFGRVEHLSKEGAVYDAVLAMEIVEHVADINLLMRTAATLVRSNGCMILSTLNRTAKSYALAIIGAEYVLRWLPQGTHDWRRFLKPSELVGHLRRNGLTAADMTGVVYNPLERQWRLDRRDLAVNYMIFAEKDGVAGRN